MMSTQCAACRSLTAKTVATAVPYFLEPIVFPNLHRGARRFYACIACTQQWEFDVIGQCWTNSDFSKPEPSLPLAA